MKDFFKSLIDSSKERIKSPLMGAFILSWLVFNWKAIFTVLFSSNPIESKISVIESKYSSLTFTLWAPFSVALIYIVVLPYLMWFFDKILLRANEGRKAALLKGQLFDTKSKQKLALEEIEFEKIKAEYMDKADLNQKIEFIQNQLQYKDNVIENLNNELKESMDRLVELKSALNKQNDQTLTKDEIEKYYNKWVEFKESDIFRFFEQLGAEVSRRGKVPNTLSDLVIEKYIHQGIIKESPNYEMERTSYELTKLGNYLWRQFLSSIKIVKKEPDNEPDDLPF